MEQDNELTNRLAVNSLDFDEIQLSTLFRILESKVNNKIRKIGLYTEKTAYAICEFTDVKSAKEVYDELDGLEIEQTGYLLDFSFVPNDYKLGILITECIDSSNFKGMQIKNKKIEINENVIDLSDEINVDFNIPEEFKTKEIPEENLKEEIEIEDSSSHHILEALKTEEVKNETEFVFDATDIRFKDLYEDEDFMLDASNKKFKQQKSSKHINDKKFEKRTEVQ